MRFIDDSELSFVPIENGDNNEEDPIYSNLTLLEKGTKCVIRGVLLEAAVKWKDKYLFFTTQDCPFEEMLDIWLFDSNLVELDSVLLGTIYSTGTFEDLQLQSPNFVQFRFIGDTDWKVELFDKHRFSFPMFSEPKGVWRGLKFKRHFRLHGDPKPETR